MSVERIHKTTDVFRTLGADVTERTYDGAGHEVTDDELDFAGPVLASVLPAEG